MRTDCTEEQLVFQGVGGRQVVARFDGGRITSDAGILLLREVAERTGLLRRFAHCFTDHRDAALIEHTVEELVAQRVLALACGYEDLNDHDVLRDDALLAVAAGKRDATGATRPRARDQGHALAGKSTLNRLEGTPATATAAARYKKIVYQGAAIEAWFVEAFLAAHPTPPAEIVLDLDATDDPLHGQQEGRFFHGYYRAYCYLPLYIFAGDFLLAAKLRRASGDGAAGAVEEVARIVAQLRAQWPGVRIVVRGDSGFARDALMSWCEAHDVDYVLGLARNARLEAAVSLDLALAEIGCAVTQAPVRRYRELEYRTQDSWTRTRRVVAKAEYLPGKANPRFVVTSLPVERWAAAALYEDLYCARGDMENRIKEQQLGLFADRTSTATMRANQLRLWFSSVAYVLVESLRRVGLADTGLARAQVGTIRTRLLKLGALVTVSVRRVVIALSSVFPLQRLFAQALANLQRGYPLRC
ncbi:MAG TPA: IS1380 family transposase [Gemmatimonadales bacterium]|nr:IS1380 family transposase [Gemmatimonadales bacterium]